MRGSGVLTTCGKRATGMAYARSQVYKAAKARRDIGGALWDSETGDGVVCSSAERKELKLTRKMRAAWAGMSGLRQDLFRASCNDPITSWTQSAIIKRV